jgi:hypothetical protein
VFRRAYIEDESKDKRKKSFDFTGWTNFIAEDRPMQVSLVWLVTSGASVLNPPKQLRAARVSSVQSEAGSVEVRGSKGMIRIISIGEAKREPPFSPSSPLAHGAAHQSVSTCVLMLHTPHNTPHTPHRTTVGTAGSSHPNSATIAL